MLNLHLCRALCPTLCQTCGRLWKISRQCPELHGSFVLSLTEQQDQHQRRVIKYEQIEKETGSEHRVV